ncbi:MAG: ATP-dependent nuclease [Phycisphaerales bacterium]
MRIKHIVASGLFGYKDTTVLQDLASPTIIIGKNNCGKSNILKLLQIARRVAATDLRSSSWAFSDAERYQDRAQDSAVNCNLEVTITLDNSDRNRLPDALAGLRVKQPDEPAHWLAASGDAAFVMPLTNGARQIAKVAPVGRKCFIQANSTEEQHFVNFVLQTFHRQTVLLPAFRRDTDNRSQGGTIIKQLHEWSAPDSHQRHLRRRFEAVQQTFLFLSDLHDAQLVPQADGKAMQISWKGRYLPFDSFGDGFKHLLIIAFELEINPGAVFLLEEPETHLHPGIQRRLLALCRERTDAQFIITTHAPAILDSLKAGSVFRVFHDGDASHVAECKAKDKAYEVLDDLGVRPSDLLQANAAIWVEGPSDRLFLKKCLELVAPELSEGLHFQIVFYGGRLRAHLTAGGDGSLVDILALCRKVAMIADSDMATAEDGLDHTKLRLRQEIQQAGGFYWITEGREIENYFPAGAVNATLSSLVTGHIPFTNDRFRSFSDAVGESLSQVAGCPQWLQHYDNNKVRFVSMLVGHLSADAFSDSFSKNVLALVNFIKTAQLEP